MDSTGSEQGPVAACCECGDEPSGSWAKELVIQSLLCVKKSQCLCRHSTVLC
jgi:hypothetical protein